MPICLNFPGSIQNIIEICRWQLKYSTSILCFKYNSFKTTNDSPKYTKLTFILFSKILLWIYHFIKSNFSKMVPLGIKLTIFWNYFNNFYWYTNTHINSYTFNMKRTYQYLNMVLCKFPPLSWWSVLSHINKRLGIVLYSHSIYSKEIQWQSKTMWTPSARNIISISAISKHNENDGMHIMWFENDVHTACTPWWKVSCYLFKQHNIPVGVTSQ